MISPRFCAPLVAGLFLVAASVFGQTALESYRQGQAAFQREDYWSAIDDYRDALKGNPKYFEAFQGLAEAFFAIGEYDEASKQVAAALKLGPLSSTVNVLNGRILLGQMKNEEALAQFQAVLAREPKNQAAQFGLAEYQVMKGRLEQASNQFEVLRRDDPTNIRALLSLMYVLSARGDRPGFDRVYADAVRYHSADPRVHLAAAEEMYRRKDLAGARTALDQFLSVSAKTDLRGWLLQAKVLLDEGRNLDVVQTLESKVIQGPPALRGSKNPEAWYLRALALARLGKGAEASDAFRMALGFDPSNETYALAYETWLLRKTGPEDALRVPQSKVHLDRAADLAAKNFQALALDEYRRALRLDPFSVKARLGRGDIWMRQGLRTSSLEELEAVAAQNPGYKAVSFLDDLEIQRSLYKNSLAAQWGLSASDLDALNSEGTSRLYRPYTVGVYYDPDASSTAEYGAAPSYAEAFADEWDSLRFLQVVSSADDQRAQPARGFNDAFLQARNLGLEYFALVTFREGSRDFAIQVNLYLGRTGRLVQTYSVYKKGNLPVTLGIREGAAVASVGFPLRGSVVRRQGADVLVNLGKRDGVAPGQKFTVLRDGAAEPTGDAAWFTWNPTDAFGTWTSGTSDDWTTVGKLEKTGFFDTVAIGDEVLFVKDPPKAAPATPLPVSALLQRDLLALR
jgi:tetratricopeptide (TPR) repeat protein